MARLAYFKYVVLKHFPEKDKDSVILVKPGEKLAKSAELVARQLMREIPVEEDNNLDNIEIIVSPF